MSEFVKYNPPNIQPENFLQPPTREISDIWYLVQQYSELLEHKKLWSPKKQLLVGTELEVLFFSRNIDPAVSAILNPNYSPKHLQTVKRLTKKASALGKHPFMFKANQFGRLGIEYRTEPLPVKDYLEAILRLQEHISHRSKKEGVLPVVHSQHIHLSLTCGASNEILRLERNERREKLFRAKIVQIFGKLNSLVLLPEEWSERRLGFPFTFNGHPSSKLNQHRIEVRRLSSEYACDSNLNLLISLFALYKGLHNKNPSNYRASNDYRTYEEAMEDMEEDKELRDFFGASTLTSLVKIVSQYPSISRREKTLKDISLATSKSI